MKTKKPATYRSDHEKIVAVTFEKMSSIDMVFNGLFASPIAIAAY